MKRYRLIVSGKVQGVFYRVSTRDKARELGLSGFVKNQADGSVLIEAEGNDNQLNELEYWTKIGPKYADVSKVESSEIEVKGDTGFKIKS